MALSHSLKLNTLRPRQNGRHFADNTFIRIFMNENVRISINISLKFVPKGPINNIPALVQIMAWRRPGDKPLSEPMIVNLPTHICVTLPQWIKCSFIRSCGTFLNAFSVEMCSISTIKTLAPGRFDWNFRQVIFKITLANVGWGISCEIALRWMSLCLTDDKSTLVQVMACSCLAQIYIPIWCH